LARGGAGVGGSAGGSGLGSGGSAGASASSAGWRKSGVPLGVGGRRRARRRQQRRGRRGRRGGGAGGAGGANDPELVRLALHTLGEFDFVGIVLTEFVRDSLVRYLDDDDTAIRVEAALTCAKLLAQTGGEGSALPTRGYAATVIGDVLEKLLVVAISDPDPTIRRAVLAALGPRFDHHLAQAEALRALFVVLNDEVFEIRELAISVIGRLTMRNPAYVMPSLRKTLIQLLTELEFSGDSLNKEESARLLGHLIRSARRLVRPYVNPLLRALLPKLRDRSARVASCVLSALGELSVVGGDALKPHLDTLLPMIIATLQDQSSTGKRQVALYTLGQLAESTGFVIEPFVRYPRLLEILLGLVKTETQPQIRLEVLRVLGILGALDPYRHRESRTSAAAARGGTLYGAAKGELEAVAREDGDDGDGAHDTADGGGGGAGGGGAAARAAAALAPAAALARAAPAPRTTAAAAPRTTAASRRRRRLRPLRRPPTPPRWRPSRGARRSWRRSPPTRWRPA
jgi:hypothetical protein